MASGLLDARGSRLRARVGYLNPTLYGLSGSGVFKDVTCCGSNAYRDAPGYPVGDGWDAATGFGSVRGTKLVEELAADLTDLYAALIPALL
jgi:hypothetical protein